MIAFVKLHQENKIDKALVFCPASLKNQWLNELHKCTYLDGIVISGTPIQRSKQWKKAYDPAVHFVFINYDLLLGDYDTIFSFCSTYSDSLVLILDEAQKIKNWKAKRSKMMKGGKVKEGDKEIVYPGLPAKYKWLLTGTPMENSPGELYNLFNFMRPEVLGYYNQFKEKYIQLDRWGYPCGVKNLSQLRQVISPYMLRRRISDVEGQFPDIRYLDIELEMTAFQNSLHKTVSAEIMDLIEQLANAPEEARSAIMGKFSILMSIASSPETLSMSRSPYASKLLETMNPTQSALKSSPKVDWVRDYIESRMESNPNSKTVIFTKFRRMQNILWRELKDLGKIYLLNGDTTDREESKQGFWNDGNMFISTDAGSTGLNLQCSDVLINIDCPWNPAVLAQRNGRIRRAGSKHERVTIINLTSINSIDERIRKVLYDKQYVFDRVIESNDSDEEIIRNMSSNVLANLVVNKGHRRRG